MSEQKRDPDHKPSLLDELRHRRVFRVAFAYGVVAWVLMQAGEIVFPAFELPASALRALILSLAVGLPIVILLAWVLDVTPTGIRISRRISARTRLLSHSDSDDPAVESELGKSLEMLLLGVFVPVFAFGTLLTVLALGDTTFAPPTAAPPTHPEASIAVLPFEDLSMANDNGFFSRGMHEDILTQLTRVADLKVISRTSVMAYDGLQVSAREIGQDLGVAHVLEGSVRRSATQVRVTAQLVRAETNEQLWAQRFDAKLEDVFGVQSEIADAIAIELASRLGRSEPPKPAASQERAVVPAAYDAYLKARDLHRNLDAEDRSALARARHLYELALEQDHELVPAWLQLGILHTQAYWFGFDTSEERLRLARKALDQAERLGIDPDQLALAEGIYAYYAQADLSRALLQFDEATRRAPANADAHFYRGMILRRSGALADALEAQSRSLELDPLNHGYREELALTLALAGELSRAREENVELLRRDPSRLRARFQKWQLDLELDGDPERLLGEILDTPRDRWLEQHYSILETVAVLAGRPEEAIQALEGRPRSLPDTGHADFRLALLDGFAGQTVEREEGLARAREKFERFLAASGQRLPAAEKRSIEALFAAAEQNWSVALALQGQSAAAPSIEQDRILGSPALWQLLQFQLAAGQIEAALATFDRLSSNLALGSIPSGGHFVLAHWPEFESARRDPRIQTALASARPAYSQTWVLAAEGG